jgi:hypothetical protein
MNCKICGSIISEAQLIIYNTPVCSPVCNRRYKVWKHNKNTQRKVKEARREHNRRLLEINAEKRPIDTSTHVLMEKGEVIDPEGLKEALKRKPLDPPPIELTRVQRAVNSRLIKYELSYLGKEAVFCNRTGNEASKVSHLNKSIYHLNSRQTF